MEPPSGHAFEAETVRVIVANRRKAKNGARSLLVYHELPLQRPDLRIRETRAKPLCAFSRRPLRTGSLLVRKANKREGKGYELEREVKLSCNLNEL